MITEGINRQEIETRIQDQLNKMYRPEVVVNQDKKDIIKEESLTLNEQFIEIIETFNTNSDDYDNYVDRVCDKIDSFIESFENLLNTQGNKFFASSIATIWYGFFIECQKELESSPTDKMFFEYGEQKLRPIIQTRFRN